MCVVSVTGCDEVPLFAPTKSIITLFASSQVAALNGSVEIIANVIEQSGQPVQNGTLVTFTTTLGTINPREARTSAGRVYVMLSAGSLSGTAKIGAISGDAKATEIEVKVGGALVERVDLTATPGVVSSLGGSVLVLATVSDATGNRLSGVTVTFTSTAGTLSSTSVVTGDNGEARTILSTNRETTVTATAAGKQATFTVRANTPPTASITSDPTSPLINQAVTFTIAVTAGSGPIRDVTVNYGDGEAQSLGAFTGTTRVTHSYRSSGSYTITVTATDINAERTNVSTVISIGRPAPIGVTITASSTNPTINTSVSFTANVTPSTAQIRRYRWDFGDGSGTDTTGNQTSHVYRTTGRKTVSVDVEPVDGDKGYGEIQIAVQPAPGTTSK